MEESDILYHLTVSTHPDDFIVTIYGQMTYRQWLEDVELPRIKRKCHWPVVIYTNPETGGISLVHLRVKMPPGPDDAGVTGPGAASTTDLPPAPAPAPAEVGTAARDDAPPAAKSAVLVLEKIEDPDA